MTRTPEHQRVVVVGSGPTGATAAHTLVRRGVPVTLLDAGVRRPRGLVVRACGNTVVRVKSWHGSATVRDPSSDHPVEWLSSRVLGGLSCYWTGSVPRFAATDFVEGARLDDRFRWPISSADLAEHYDAVEQTMDLTGGDGPATVPASLLRHVRELPPDWRTIRDAVAAGSSGRSLGLMPMAKGAPWMVTLRGTEFNSYDRLVEPLERSADLVVLRGRHVVRLERSTTGGPVDTVVAIDRGTKRVERHRAVAIVLAAGAIDTTAILLRSDGRDHPGGLGNAHDVLGRYLHDHPKQWWRMRLDRPARALAHPLYLTSPPADAHRPMETAGFTLGLGRREDRVRTWVAGRSHHLGVLTFATVPPCPDARVEVVGADDAEALETIRITMQFGDRTHELLDASRSACVATLRDAGLGGTVDLANPHGCPGSSFHLGGSARMHDDPRYGVVDGENRLHEAPEVLVVDAACFTTGPEKNPTVTAMAIARRAAARLADRLRSATPATTRPQRPQARAFPPIIPEQV